MLEFKKKAKNFLNKGTEHKTNYMEGINSKNKNIKGGRSPYFLQISTIIKNIFIKKPFNDDGRG